MGKRSKKYQPQQQKQPQKVMASDPLPEVLSQDETPLLLSVAETCRFLGGISRSTLYRLEKSGAMAGCRVDLGGVVRFHRQALVKWINNQVQSVR